jgi:ferredoxin
MHNAKEISSNAKVIGIIYPCYLAQISGVPNIVFDFVNRLKPNGSAYIFAICTYGAFGLFNSVPTHISLNTIARGKGLVISAQFSIKLPLNNLDYDHVPVPVSRNHEKMFAYTETKIKNMVKVISNRRIKQHKIILMIYKIATRPIFIIMGKYVMKSLKERVNTNEKNENDFRNLIKMSDYSISVNENCIGCGICKKVCPAKNIEIANGKPVWLHNCEMCLACDEWCPQKAIHHWCKEIGKDYHHPGITLSEIIKYNESGT